MNKKNHKYKAKNIAELSVQKLLEYVQTEVVLLQEQLQYSAQPDQEEHYADDMEGAEVLGSLTIESFLWDAIFGSLFGGTMMAEMFGMLSDDGFDAYLGGLSVLFDNDARSQRLQGAFILSVYPKGRRTVRTIIENVSSGDMRRHASHSFMTPRETHYQLAVLGDAEKKLKKMYEYCVSHVSLDPRQSIQRSIDNSFRSIGHRSSWA